MSKQNFYKNLIRGLQTSYATSQKAAYNRAAAKEQNAKDLETERIKSQLALGEQRQANQLAVDKQTLASQEERRKQQEQATKDRAASSNFNALLSGKVQGQDALNLITNFDKPQLNSLKSMIGIQNSLFNPPKKTIVSRKFGKDENGNQVLTLFYNDGSHKIMKNPMQGTQHRTPKADIPFMQLPPLKFDSKIARYTRDRDAIEKLKLDYTKYSAYDAPEAPVIRSKVNDIANNNAQTLFDLMDDKSKQQVYNFYARMKQMADENQMTVSSLTNDYQNDLQQEFIQRATIAKHQGLISKRQLRVLSLWAKFNFGHIAEVSNGKTTK